MVHVLAPPSPASSCFLLSLKKPSFCFSFSIGLSTICYFLYSSILACSPSLNFYRILSTFLFIICCYGVIFGFSISWQ